MDLTPLADPGSGAEPQLGLGAVPRQGAGQRPARKIYAAISHLLLDFTAIFPNNFTAFYSYCTLYTFNLSYSISSIKLHRLG